ncbi:MAG TPA: Helicase associated domain protein, partial [Umezawaea sp.]|nr:Helicase associated domain protein [Umezawaea sp.]
DAEEFARTLPVTLQALDARHQPARAVHAEHIHGRMKQAQRRIVLGSLADPPDDGWSVISNAKCLGEGIDVPAVDCVVFTAPKESTVDIVQAVGRALRRNTEGTGVATILVPILLPDDPGEVDEILDAGDYDVLWQVIMALRAHDEVFGGVLDQARADTVPAEQVRAKIEIDLPDLYDNARFLDHLTIRIVKSATSQWWDGYGHLVRFHRTHGHPDFPATYVTDEGYKLGSWAGRCRHQHRNHRLAPDRVAALTSLGFDFDPAQALWKSRLAFATTYRAEHGHLEPPTGVRLPDGKDLKAWLRYNRRAFLNGELTTARRAALDTLGMRWSVPDPWKITVDKIVGFHTERGHLQVYRTSDDPAAAEVAKLIVKCRSQRRKGKLAATWVAALDAVGIVWEPVQDLRDDGLQAARRFHAEHGHLLPDSGYVDATGYPVASWLHTKRREYGKAALSEDMVEALDALGMAWNYADAQWQHGLAAATRFHAEHGHLRVPPDHPLSPGLRGRAWSLYRWLESIRSRARQRGGTVSAEQIAALDALCMEWDPLKIRWENTLAILSAFHARRGSLVPSPEDEDYKLVSGHLEKLRKSYRAGTLAPDRVDVLNKMGIVWNPGEVPWDTMITFLRGYHAQHGTIAVPPGTRSPNGVVVLVWLNVQRTMRREGRLPADRIAALDELGIDWQHSGKQKSWATALADAQLYHSLHGHLDVIETDPHPSGGTWEVLSAWLVKQLRNRHRNELKAERVAALEALGIDWTGDRIKKRRWQYHFDLLRSYRDRHGNTDISADAEYPEGIPLGTWLECQRRLKWLGRLDPRHQALLDTIGVEWNTDPFGHWAHAIGEATAHVRQHGPLASVRGRTTTTNGFFLSHWIARVKQKAEQGELSSSQLRQLAELGLPLIVSSPPDTPSDRD